MTVDDNVDHGTLTLTAHRSARSDDGVQWLANERFSGTYRRQLSLGEGTDTTKIAATYENGVLTVTIPWPSAPSHAGSKSPARNPRHRSNPPPSTLNSMPHSRAHHGAPGM
ncbi:hypothetical protein BH10ACT9_BH10ACT9_46100 [soil metagenome]